MGSKGCDVTCVDAVSHGFWAAWEHKRSSASLVMALCPASTTKYETDLRCASPPPPPHTYVAGLL